MLPPVLEIYVVWHPGDAAGAQICEEFLEHFHGSAFSGLIGGAIEVYARSTGWQGEGDAPRPIPLSPGSLAGDMREAQFIAIVPVLGNEFAASVEQDGSPWRVYSTDLMRAHDAERSRIGVFPFVLDPTAMNGTALNRIFGPLQRIAANEPGEGETPKSLRCRDLAQGITQMLSQAVQRRLTVFISHTRRHSPGERENVEALIAAVRQAIGNTRLADFFDANDLQAGQDWDAELRRNAATSALLGLRTHLYASREWCQREVLIAKREGMPVIVMDALEETEERGSFLMDHVPRVPIRLGNGHWSNGDIHCALNLLVDECLKRALWRHQAALAEDELDLGIVWWAPHAPEPVTFAKWIENARAGGQLAAEGEDIRVLHPDPPLGADERLVLQEMLALGGVRRTLDVMTPRMLAARSG